MLQSLLNSLKNTHKTLLVVGFDVISVIAAFLLSFSLRLGVLIPAQFEDIEFLMKLAVVLPVHIVIFYWMGLYKGIWRFSSTPDLLRIIKAITLAIPFSFCGLFIFNLLDLVPRSVFIIEWFLLLVCIGGGRFAYRVYRDNILNSSNLPENRAIKTLIVGAGYAGVLLLRDVKSDLESKIHVVGFLDDDYGKRGKILHGVKVLGSVADLKQIADISGATEVVIAIPSATKEQISKIVSSSNDTNLKVKTVPRFGDLISGKVQITKLRKVTPEDLLGRDQVELDVQKMSHMITDKIIIVTGAGGSIGSELCIQIAKFKPKKLICFDISEYNLYELGFKLEKFKEFTALEYVIGDVRDSFKVESVFSRFRPNIAFHAAAYKHVPMMELNPYEAIKVNVIGTKTVASFADKYKLEKFVLVSTDKAVNPTNVMGTTKRIAELICQYVQKYSKTKFEVVRFGNVLGSSGSVIPRFQKQIEDGGPVTVTHPDIIRYFMSIPEAAQLVIQAGALGNGGEVFILDMGEPVKIVDLAKQMITLAGLKLDEDIDIEYSGLRPGEKLFEELLLDTEDTLPTAHERVRVAKVDLVPDDLFERIIQLLNEDDHACIRTKLKNIVPEYAIPEDLLNKNKLSYSSVKFN
jgi:FlaA1/EpsC-like NDP-sugar epimerase